MIELAVDERRSFAQSYKTRKHMPKKQVQKLRPGTFVQVKWSGQPDTVAMLVGKSPTYPGLIELRVISASSNNLFYINSKQVVAVLGEVVFPAPFSGLTHLA